MRWRHDRKPLFAALVVCQRSRIGSKVTTQMVSGRDRQREPRPSSGAGPQFYDPDGARFGIPTYPYHFAPEGLLTRRQLRAQGLRPGGQDIQAQILWQHRNARRVAYLYDVGQARPKREATPAQLAALGKAMDARKTCPSCGQQQEFCIKLTSLARLKDQSCDWAASAPNRGQEQEHAR